MTETLQEFFDSRGVSMRVDREAGVIRGVKILGISSRNGRSYLPEALTQATRLYEDAKVNVNHPKGHPGGPRDYQDRIGVIRNVRARDEEGLFADFHYNPKHALAEQLAWDAEHAPENVGFSHNVQARTTRRGDRVMVEAITKVQSVDLVADPATTRGLFESSAGTAATSPTVEDLKRDHPELVEALCRQQDAELSRLRAEVERLEALEAATRKRTIARRLLREFHLPDPDGEDARTRAIVSEYFLETLLAANDEEAMRALVEERAALVKSLGGAASLPAPFGQKPLSRDQHLFDARRFGGGDTRNAKTFVEAIT